MIILRCHYFNKCGGCSLQHIDYPVQLENKKKALVSALGFEDIKVFSGMEYNYRNRMDFIFHENGLGLRRKGKENQIIDVEECGISVQKINELLKEARMFFKQPDYYALKTRIGTFKYAVIRAAENSSILFVLNESSSKLKEAVEKIREFAAKSSADNVVVTYVNAENELRVSEDFFAVKGDSFLMETYLGKKFTYSLQVFFQNNHEMAEKMHKYCNELLKSYDTKDFFLLDLYSGVGTFGIINSAPFKRVVMVESVKQCIEAANKNIEENNAGNAEAILLDARYLKKLELPEKLFLIADPPRSGMHPDTIRQINKIKPKIILYVSCNAEQLKKDLPKFREHEIKSAALFDFFPQTMHSEAVVEMVLKENIHYNARHKYSGERK